MQMNASTRSLILNNSCSPSRIPRSVLFWRCAYQQSTLDQNPTEAELEKCCHRIGFDVFLPIMQMVSRGTDGNTAEDLTESLRHFDKDSSSSITSTELSLLTESASVYNILSVILWASVKLKCVWSVQRILKNLHLNFLSGSLRWKSSARLKKFNLN